MLLMSATQSNSSFHPRMVWVEALVMVNAPCPPPVHWLLKLNVAAAGITGGAPSLP